MVEFGLKLQDNKVAEWSDKYIEYEKLKLLLKRAEVASAKYRELAKKRPTVALQVAEAVRAGFPTPRSSRADLTDTTALTTSPPTRGSPKTAGSTHSLTAAAMAIVKDAIIPPTDATTKEPAAETHQQQQQQQQLANYGTLSTETGSSMSTATLTRTDSFVDVFQRAWTKATSGVADYVARNYERQIRDAIKEADQLADQFAELLTANIDHVNAFYKEQLQELLGRVHFLKENVAHYRAKSPELLTSAPDEQPEPKHRLTHSTDDDAIAAMTRSTPAPRSESRGSDNSDDLGNAFMFGDDEDRLLEETPLISHRHRKRRSTPLVEIAKKTLSRFPHRRMSLNSSQGVPLVTHHEHHSSDPAGDTKIADEAGQSLQATSSTLR